MPYTASSFTLCRPRGGVRQIPGDERERGCRKRNGARQGWLGAGRRALARERRWGAVAPLWWRMPGPTNGVSVVAPRPPFRGAVSLQRRVDQRRGYLQHAAMLVEVLGNGGAEATHACHHTRAQSSPCRGCYSSSGGITVDAGSGGALFGAWAHRASDTSSSIIIHPFQPGPMVAVPYPASPVWYLKERTRDLRAPHRRFMQRWTRPGKAPAPALLLVWGKRGRLLRMRLAYGRSRRGHSSLQGARIDLAQVEHLVARTDSKMGARTVRAAHQPSTGASPAGQPRSRREGGALAWPVADTAVGGCR